MECRWSDAVARTGRSTFENVAPPRGTKVYTFVPLIFICPSANLVAHHLRTSRTSINFGFCLTVRFSADYVRPDRAKTTKGEFFGRLLKQVSTGQMPFLSPNRNV